MEIRDTPEAQAERHRIAEERRAERKKAEEEADERRAREAAGKAPVVHRPAVVEELPVGSLTELFGLTGVAVDVDREIVDGACRFTREDLKAYFEALGCTYSHEGSHPKLSFPEEFTFSATHLDDRDGKTIAVLCEIGGAVTVAPTRDGTNDQWPSYFIKQILNARRILCDNFVKARDEAKRIAEAAAVADKEESD